MVMKGSKRSRRRIRHHIRVMAKLGMRPCGCCWTIDERQKKQIDALVREIRTGELGADIRL